ncbi:pentapeptide repeat-containing protein [Parashewanella spongiae]|uniref:Pentapeptide repeat-containing protein n=1 Tax=Parashewanella spongiae TaxID=342950 RepID=A0A3A6TU66_9GAMM|nr:pentapeptide repeat-containing protein [Parashewanella spongiae]MCL1078089.1 pentapeptide repeat-containing protein [Parashewanella spongiae]RJY16459.1 pentapeptide repeat-containing protein [Parashewanella spongiae]
MAFYIEHVTNSTSCQHALSENQLNKLLRGEKISHFGKRACLEVKNQRDKFFNVLSCLESSHGDRLSAFLSLKTMQVVDSQPGFFTEPIFHNFGLTTSQSLGIKLESKTDKSQRLYKIVVLSGQEIQPIRGTDKIWLKLDKMRLTALVAGSTASLTPQRVNWIKCDASNTDFRYVHFVENEFSQVNGENFDLSQTELKHCAFKSCKLPKLKLTSTQAAHLVMQNCDLTGADLSNGSFQDAQFNDVDFSSVNLSFCNFSGAKFIDCTFDEHTKWESAKLVDVTTNNPRLQKLVDKTNQPQITIPPQLSGMLNQVAGGSRNFDSKLLSASSNSLSTIPGLKNSTSISDFHAPNNQFLHVPTASGDGLLKTSSCNSLLSMTYHSAGGITKPSQIRKNSSQLL